MAKKFSSKDPIEIILVSFDFSGMFVSDTEVLTGVTWASVVKEGTDNNPSAILGSPSNDATTSSCLISGGLDGVSYLVSAVGTTSIGQKLKLSGIMPVAVQG